ncbi:MAG: GerMN domain-containing protein [Bacilli bacterium]|nr:GerMN domain-containing protein [Bacilli bacterium]
MLKRFSLNRILKMTLFLFIFFLFCLYPKKNNYELKTSPVIAGYYHDIYLLDYNNYVSKTTISVSSIEKEKLAKDLLTSLIVDSNNSSKLPEGFKAIIPKGTKIQKVRIDNKYLTISFSKNILKTNNKDKMLECIVYTLTSINDIKYIKILIDDKENNFFDKEYSRNYGINKEYNIINLKNINDITLYYVSKYNDVSYYIPVTKYYNSNEDKIKIIIDELSSRSSYQSNLMSYLNYDTKLINYTMDNNDLYLYFDQSVLGEDGKILEEVRYSISYSIKDTLPVNNIHFYVEEKEI